MGLSINFGKSFGVILLLVLSSFQAMAFSVGTLNLWHYMDDYETRVENLKKEKNEFGIPEILSLQEAARWSNQSIYDELIGLIGYKGFYQNTNEFALMNEGLALDSSLQGRDFESLELPATRMFSRQYMISGIFKTEVGDVAVVSTHFSPSGEDAQYEQAKFVVQHIQKFKIPVIILGDLNEYPNSKALKVFKDAGFTDSLDWKEKTYVPGENPYNKGDYGPERLDYVLYRPTELKLVSSSLFFNKNIVSDHYGIKAEFTLAPKTKSFSQCPDLSGSFRGLCHEERKDGKKFQYDMQYDVLQNKCDKIEIKITTYPDEWSVMEIYDLTKELTQFDGGDNVQIISGGKFDDDSFAGTVLYVNTDEHTVDTNYNQYQKISKGGESYLKLDQTGHGVRMSCEMKFVELQ